MYNETRIDWNSKLNNFDRALLSELADCDIPSVTGNIVCDAVQVRDYAADDRNIIVNFAEKFGHLKGFNKGSVSRLATLCQMMVYDRDGGPDGDKSQKGLRRHWYAWFKVNFAQDFSAALAAKGDKKEVKGFDGRAWAGRLSEIYGGLVDDENVTYKDLWVSDTSRMEKSFWGELFRNCYIILCVEKDSLFSDFEKAAQAIGAKVLVSGKGKMSKAATELVLRKHFGWTDRRDPFTADRPLLVLTLTDWDYDGETVIAPTFAEQCRRYTNHVQEARIGITPDQGIQGNGPLFEAKTTNDTYKDWARDKGLYNAECGACGHSWITVGDGAHNCPACDSQVYFLIALKDSGDKTAYGFEVEALRTKAYYPMIVDALLTLVDFDTLVGHLRDECVASEYNAADAVWAIVESKNETLAKLNETIEKLERYRDAFQDDVRDRFIAKGAPMVNNWRDDDDDPTPQNFRDYVEKIGYAEVWRPFKTSDRTRSLVDALTDPQDIEVEVTDKWGYVDVETETVYHDDDVQEFIGKNIFKAYRGS
jgi:hypothetical protein